MPGTESGERVRWPGGTGPRVRTPAPAGGDQHPAVRHARRTSTAELRPGPGRRGGRRRPGGRADRGAGHLTGPGRARDRRPAALPADGRSLRADRAGAAHLRLPRARPGRFGRRGRGRAGPDPAVAGRAAGAERQLPVLAGTGQFLRELPATRRGAAGRARAPPSGSGPRRPTRPPWSRWCGPGRCWTRAWSTSTRGCPSTTRRSRCGSPTCACGHEDAVLIAALVRALVETEARAWRQDAAAAADARRTAPARGLAGQPVRPGRPAGRPAHRPARRDRGGDRPAAGPRARRAGRRGRSRHGDRAAHATCCGAATARRSSATCSPGPGSLRDVVASAAGAISRMTGAGWAFAWRVGQMP